MHHRSLRQLFTEHPTIVGESYLEHMGVALGFAGALMLASMMCLVHAFAPWLFTKTASSAVRNLYARMVTGRVRTARSGAATDP